LTFGASCSAFVRLSARFCLSVFADFLLIPCRGDLSLIADPFVWGLVGPGALIVRFSPRLVDPQFAPDTIRHRTADTHPGRCATSSFPPARGEREMCHEVATLAEIRERSIMQLLRSSPAANAKLEQLLKQFTIHKPTALLPVSPIPGGPCP
jgi:hypothetical protein